MADIAASTFTPEAIAQWEKEKDRLEKLIVDSQRKLGAVQQLLRAAAILGAKIEEEEEEEEGAKGEAPEVDSSNLMGLIAKYANESLRPITKSDMKARLIEAGIEENRLRSYFYVAIARLKRKERISVLDDGRIWRAPTKS
jgi:hypothetical protein